MNWENLDGTNAFSNEPELQEISDVTKAAWNLLKTKQDHGYQLKSTDFKQSQKAYADDRTIISGSVNGCKDFLSLVETFLKWTGTMEAKPSKM